MNKKKLFMYEDKNKKINVYEEKKIINFICV